jgi:hypothetical protein
MAIITPVVPLIAGAVAAFAPSAPAGDEIKWTGGDLLIEFLNGHSASITVNFAPTKTTGFVAGAGKVTIPTRSLVLAQNAHGAFLFPRTQLQSYLNANSRIPITYTSGNVALVLRAFHLN